MDIAYWVQGAYVLTAVFGLGVTAIDMLGLLGNSDDADGGVDDVSIGEGWGKAGGEIGGSGDSPDGGLTVGEAGDVDAFGGEASGDVQGNGVGGESSGALTEGEMTHGDLDADGASSRSSGQHVPLLIVMANLRRAVYFSLGFGPVGLVSMSTGGSVPVSMMWAVPSGLVSMFLARAFFRFQQRDIDSSLRRRDLIMEPAEVLVPIAAGQMGRVRIYVGQSVVDRFARGENPRQSFAKGQQVVVARVANDCVYVESPDPTIETH